MPEKASSFEEQFAKDTKDLGIGEEKNAWYKPKDGENKIRILSTPQHNQSRYGYGTVYEGASWAQPGEMKKDERLINRWLSWIIDRADGKTKLYNMPYSIAKEIVSLKSDDEYAFQDFPMPYDLTIKVKGAGTKEVEYSVLPSRKESALTEEERAAYDEQNDVGDIIEAMKEKSRKKYGDALKDPGYKQLDGIDYKEEQPGEIPF